jgi:hypothetical protein
MVKKPPRNEPRPETRRVVHLAQFVMQETGKHYWGSLAVLLRKPTGVEFNKASLRELVKFHKAKADRSRHYSRQWFPRGFLTT